MTKKDERAKKHQRYSTIDHHLDLTAGGGFTVTQKAPFERVVPGVGRGLIVGLTEQAQKIIDAAKKAGKHD